MKEQFQARMLRIHFSETDRWEGEALYKSIVAKCMALGMEGATLFRGVEGFGASARIYHRRSLSITKNAPLMVTVIDSDEQIQKLLPHLDRMIQGGVIASSRVDAIRYSHSHRPSTKV
jgi:PII-like signaling protein